MLKFTPLGCLRSGPCVHAHVQYVPACVCTHGTVRVCETASMPQFIVYPELIGVWESERNASSPNSQSMTLIFQLDSDLYRNPSKRQDLCVRTVTFIDPEFGKLIFAGYNRGWKLVVVEISKTSGRFKEEFKDLCNVKSVVVCFILLSLTMQYM